MTTAETNNAPITIETVGLDLSDTNQVELVGTTYSGPGRKRFGGTTVLVGTGIEKFPLEVHIPDIDDGLYGRLKADSPIPIRIVGQLGHVGRTQHPVVVARHVTLDPIDTTPKNQARLIGFAMSTKVWRFESKGLVSMFTNGGDTSGDFSKWNCERPMVYTDEEQNLEWVLDLVEGERVFVEGYVEGWMFNGRDGSVLEATTISIIGDGTEDESSSVSTNP